MRSIGISFSHPLETRRHQRTVRLFSVHLSPLFRSQQTHLNALTVQQSSRIVWKSSNFQHICTRKRHVLASASICMGGHFHTHHPSLFCHPYCVSALLFFLRVLFVFLFDDFPIVSSAVLILLPLFPLCLFKHFFQTTKRRVYRIVPLSEKFRISRKKKNSTGLFIAFSCPTLPP